jgi:hypothetical protein
VDDKTASQLFRLLQEAVQAGIMVEVRDYAAA